MQEGRRTFWGTVRILLRQPVPLLLVFLTVLICLSVLAVNVQNRFGDFWGALVSGLIAPLVGSVVLRMLMARRSRVKRSGR